jgi:hypothetical protein
VGWLAAGYALAYFIVGWEVDCCLASAFGGQWQPDPIRQIPEILFPLTAIWFLAKMCRDKTSRAVSLLICVCFAWFGLRELFARDGWSIFWFRYFTPLVKFVPGAFWLWWLRRHLAQKRNLTRGNQPIHSD